MPTQRNPALRCFYRTTLCYGVWAMVFMPWPYWAEKRKAAGVRPVLLLNKRVK